MCQAPSPRLGTGAPLEKLRAKLATCDREGCVSPSQNCDAHLILVLSAANCHSLQTYLISVLRLVYNVRKAALRSHFVSITVSNNQDFAAPPHLAIRVQESD